MSKYFVFAALAALLAGCSRNAPTLDDGMAALAKGDYKLAAKAFKAAAKAHPKSLPLLYNLGTAQALAGDGAAAIASFRDVLRFAPGDLDASEALAAELRKVGSADSLSEAHELLEFVLLYREDPGSRARALNSLSLVESALHRNDVALAHLLDARDIAPHYSPTLFNLGHLCANSLRLPSAAKAMFDAYLAAKPADAAIAAKAEKLRDAAAKSCPPPYAHVVAQEAASLIEQGVAAYSKKDYVNAERLFADAAAADPLCFDAPFNRANALYVLGRIAEARASFATAAAINPARYDVAFWGARSYYDLGDFAKASELFTSSVVPRWPDNPQSLLYTAYAYAQQERFYEARLYGTLYIAAAKRAGATADIAGVEEWLGNLPKSKFKP